MNNPKTTAMARMGMRTAALIPPALAGLIFCAVAPGPPRPQHMLIVGTTFCALVHCLQEERGVTHVS
jgi:hypothetical protein